MSKAKDVDYEWLFKEIAKIEVNEPNCNLFWKIRLMTGCPETEIVEIIKIMSSLSPSFKQKYGWYSGGLTIMNELKLHEC